MLSASGCFRRRSISLIAFILIINAYLTYGQRSCAGAQNNDAIVGQTQLFGNKNISDSIWQDQLPLYRSYGPLSKITAYKATQYDNLFHDPGELKGFQFWYGPQQLPAIYNYADGDANLMGARKPHIPGDLVLSQGELITKVELQWDPISMRGVRFWTNQGRQWDWGFLDIPGATKATSEAPVKGAYLAAMRGFEGKPRAGISKKRYLIQISLVWALPACQPAGAPPARPVQLPPSSYASANRLATNLYLLEPDTVSLIPSNVEGANIIYDGVSIQKPPLNEGLEFIINSTHMIGVKVNHPTQPLGTPTVPTRPPAPPSVVQEKTPPRLEKAAALPPTPRPAPLRRLVPQPLPTLELQQALQPVPPPVPRRAHVPQPVYQSQALQSQRRPYQPPPCTSFVCWLFG